MNTITFENNKYRIREIEIEGIGIRTIASTTLNKKLITEEGSYTSDEAIYKDEQIYFFVDPDKLNLKDSALSKYVSKYCV